MSEHRRAEAKDAQPPRSKATFDLPPELMDELRVASVMGGKRSQRSPSAASRLNCSGYEGK